MALKNKLAAFRACTQSLQFRTAGRNIGTAHELSEAKSRTEAHSPAPMVGSRDYQSSKRSGDPAHQLPVTIHYLPPHRGKFQLRPVD